MWDACPSAKTGHVMDGYSASLSLLTVMGHSGGAARTPDPKLPRSTQAPPPAST